MNIKQLTEQHLEFLSLKGGCTGWFESIHVKMPHCWKSHVTAHMVKGFKYSVYTDMSMFAYKVKYGNLKI